MDEVSVKKLIERLQKRYPNPVPALKFNSDYELLVAVILSAQCTDARVNKVTEVLFKEYSTPQKMLELSREELEKYIYSCGFYHNKAKHILAASQDIIEKFGGKVPEDFEKLKSLAGVGQKTANVVSAVAFKKQTIAVDTHVFRVSNRLGLASAATPEKTELQLKAVLPENMWADCHHYLIFFGREVCHSRNPSCSSCELSDLCNYYKNKGL